MKRPSIVHFTPDFRIYEKETIRERNGRTVVMHLCEELVEGRWEPFYSIDSIVEPDGRTWARAIRAGEPVLEPITKQTRNAG